MKKIGVITFSDTQDNYGQVLQCYALQTYLKELGHSAYLIQYKPAYIPILDRIRFKFRLLYNNRFSIKFFLNLFFPKGRKEFNVNKVLNERNKILNKKRNFKEFRDRYIAQSDNVYNSIYELRNNPPIADIYICGSDQIWNRNLYSPNTAVYFLNFGDTKVKRISYAASMGGRELTSMETKPLKSYLKDFTCIGVRESTTKDDCDRAGLSNVKVVLDPVMLLPMRSYHVLFDTVKVDTVNKYIFLYILNVENRNDIYWDEIKKYTTLCNLDIKAVYSSGYIPARELCPDITGLQATIPEWLAYIYNAESIITTSFHGIVFCIKMNKPFLVILINNRNSAGNVRITELLEALGLSDRIFDPSLPVEVQINKSINWKYVNSELKELIKDSCDFLDKNII